MRFLREIITSLPVLSPLSRWGAGYFRRPAYPGNGNGSVHPPSQRLLFFAVSSLLHAAAIFSLAATPSPKRASAIEVTLFGPVSSVESVQAAPPGDQEKKPHPPEGKAPPRARPERGEAKAAEAEAAPPAAAQSLAQALPREIPTAAAMEGGGGGQAAEATAPGPAGAGNHAGAGTAKPGPGEHGLSQYLRLVRERIGRYKKYPFLARKRELEGQVGIRFLLTGAGEAQQIAVSKSSGQELLDKAALKAVQDGAPFPRPPADLLAEPLTIELNIVFNLQ